METLGARDRWDSSLVLGIDIGTTTISAQLIEVDTRKSLQSYSIEHHAQLQADGYADAYAQNADLLLSSTTALIDSLINTYPNILSIDLTGQMHGIVCLDRNGSCISPLYSWQNKFGMRKIGRQTITDSITKLTGEPVPSGYGINTCYALKQFGMLSKGTVKIATIMDVLAARLCCSEEIITHPTNAAGLGMFNSMNLIFLSSKFSVLGLPSDIVPTVKEVFLP